MTATGVAAATKKLLFGTCDSTVESDVGTGDFSLVLGILYVCRLTLTATVKTLVISLMIALTQ